MKRISKNKIEKSSKIVDIVVVSRSFRKILSSNKNVKTYTSGNTFVHGILDEIEFVICQTVHLFKKFSVYTICQKILNFSNS